jgi:hypothetical protein
MRSRESGESEGPEEAKKRNEIERRKNLKKRVDKPPEKEDSRSLPGVVKGKKIRRESGPSKPKAIRGLSVASHQNRDTFFDRSLFMEVNHARGRPGKPSLKNKAHEPANKCSTSRSARYEVDIETLLLWCSDRITAKKRQRA